jgi:hypothetical protein
MSNSIFFTNFRPGRSLLHRLRCLVATLMLLALTWLGQPTIAAWAAEPSTDIQTEAASESLPERFTVDASDISAEKISLFVQAYLQVISLIEQREGELQAAETETESNQIQQDIEAEAITLIENTGLNLQEYLQLLGLANSDAEFGERVAAQLQESLER